MEETKAAEVCPMPAKKEEEAKESAPDSCKVDVCPMPAKTEAESCPVKPESTESCPMPEAKAESEAAADSEEKPTANGLKPEETTDIMEESEACDLKKASTEVVSGENTVELNGH